MTRNTLNFWIDTATLLVVLGLVATGLINRFVLPPHSGSMSLWGWTRHDWGNVHFWIAAAGGVLLIVHLALHWQWVCVTACRFLPRKTNAAAAHPVWRNVIGAGALAAVVALFWGMVFVGQRSVERPASGPAAAEQVAPASVAQSESDVGEPRGRRGGSGRQRVHGDRH